MWEFTSEAKSLAAAVENTLDAFLVHSRTTSATPPHSTTISTEAAAKHGKRENSASFSATAEFGGGALLSGTETNDRVHRRRVCERFHRALLASFFHSSPSSPCDAPVVSAARLLTGSSSSTPKSCTLQAYATDLEDALFGRYFYTDVGMYAERSRELECALAVNGTFLVSQHSARSLARLPTAALCAGTQLDAWRRRRREQSSPLQKNVNPTDASKNLPQEGGATLEKKESENEPKSKNNNNNNNNNNKTSARSATASWNMAQAGASEKNAEEPKGMFQCPKCRGYQTTYYSLQTRSADEPMTNFVTCLKCNLRFRR